MRKNLHNIIIAKNVVKKNNIPWMEQGLYLNIVMISFLSACSSTFPNVFKKIEFFKTIFNKI